PARVRDAEPPLPGMLEQPGLELADLARGLHDLEPALGVHRHARRVVAPILEALDALDQDRQAIPMADVADDAAHVTTSRGALRAPGAPRPRSRACRPHRATRRSRGRPARCRRAGRAPMSHLGRIAARPWHRAASLRTLARVAPRCAPTA